MCSPVRMRLVGRFPIDTSGGWKYVGGDLYPIGSTARKLGVSNIRSPRMRVRMLRNKDPRTNSVVLHGPVA